MKSMRRSIPPVERRLESSEERLFANGCAEVPSASSRSSSGSEAFSAGPAVLAELAEALEVDRRAVREGGQLREDAVDRGRRLAEFGERGDRFVGERLDPFHRRAELFEEGREVGEVAARARLPGRALAVATTFCWAKESAKRLRTCASGASARSELTASFESTRFSFAEDREHAVGFAQRGVRAHDHFVQVFAASGEARTEFVEDDPQPFGLGQLVDVGEQVWVDRARGVLDREQALALAFLPCGDDAERGRRWGAFGVGFGGAAVDVLLAEQRLRPDDAVGVGAEVLEGGVRDRSSRPRPSPAASA